jgi:hypothetical protein
MGEVKTVTWVNHGLTGAVAIFMTKTGQADRWIAQPLATAQSETIRLPFTSLAAGTGWTIKMVYVPNNALTAVGANTITVVTASPIVITYPNGGSTQALVMGTKKTVTWNQTGLLDTGQVAIYLTNPGMADRWIAQPKATLGVYEVTIPTNLAAGASANYKVKLQYTLNNAWIDSSDSTFCITANPAVTSPAAGAVWTTPSTGKTVSWNMTALTAGTQVAVYLTKDAGMADRYLTQTLASDGTKLVNIPTGLAAGTDYHIKVQWITNTAITATSAAFQITP